MKNLSFKNRALLLLIAVFCFAITSALIVNSSVRKIISELEESTEPDEKLLLLKAIMFDLSNAESAVRSYGLTDNEDYLDDYNSAISKAESTITLLYNQSNLDSNFTAEINRIETLVNSKFKVLDELLIVKNQQNISAILNEVSNKVDSYSNFIQPSENETEELVETEDIASSTDPEKKSFLNRLFKNRNKNKNEPEIAVAAEPDSEISAADNSQTQFRRLDKEITAISKKENELQQELKQTELSLIQRDKKIMKEIEVIVYNLELQEQQSIEVQTNKAKNDGKVTRILVGVFCLIMALLLGLGGYFIYSYVRKNNAYEKDLIKAKKESDAKKEEIVASITYAKRIQRAILPRKSKIERYLPNSFVIYKPKDIVAGDFYWLHHTDKYTFIAVADCTGHGVPGAMVSMSCSSALTRSLQEFRLTQPSQILDQTRKIIIEAFDEGSLRVYDGMDISLCRIDKTNGKLQFAGANNSLYMVKNGDFKQIKADREPVALFDKMTPFTNHEIDIDKSTHYYLYTDGYQDQFGGKKGKKFMSGKFKKLLKENAHLPIADQKIKLLSELKKWQNDFEQIDDISIIGFNLNDSATL